MGTPSTSTREGRLVSFSIRIYNRYEKALVRMMSNDKWHDRSHVQVRKQLRAWRDEFLATIDEEIDRASEA